VAGKEEGLSRRQFVGIGVVGAGILAAGGAAWLARSPQETNPFAYDIGPYGKTDPKLLLYDEVAHIPTGLNRARRIGVGTDERLYVAGDRAIRIFDKHGQVLRSVPLDAEVCALHAAQDGRVYVAFDDRIATFDAEGAPIDPGTPLGDKTYLTSVACQDGIVFAADAGNREVIRYTLSDKKTARFGRKQPAEEGGFIVPSPYFDVQVAPDGLLRVANTGRHRIEAYTFDGQLEEAWGNASMAVEGFCGCCNPSHFTLLPDGRFVTSEKGLNRIKVYDEHGRFQGVVAGPDQLVTDPALAQRACEDCRIGFAFDVACDAQGRILALDPCTQSIRIFAPRPSKPQET
jgi:hypothetical protein